jgi:RDD family
VIAVSIAYGIVYLIIAKLIFNMESNRPSGIIFQLGWLFSILGFYCYFWIKGGQTTGMRAWGIKLVSTRIANPEIINPEIINIEEGTITLGQALIRACLSPIGWLCCLSALIDTKKQCLHDHWSHTQLILIKKDMT